MSSHLQDTSPSASTLQRRINDDSSCAQSVRRVPDSEVCLYNQALYSAPLQTVRVLHDMPLPGGPSRIIFPHPELSLQYRLPTCRPNRALVCVFSIVIVQVLQVLLNCCGTIRCEARDFAYVSAGIFRLFHTAQCICEAVHIVGSITFAFKCTTWLHHSSITRSNGKQAFVSHFALQLMCVGHAVRPVRNVRFVLNTDMHPLSDHV